MTDKTMFLEVDNYSAYCNIVKSDLLDNIVSSKCLEDSNAAKFVIVICQYGRGGSDSVWVLLCCCGLLF